MAMPARLESKARGERLADPALRRAVEAAVKRRVPGADAEDVVQAALADVLCASHVPEDAEEFRRFVFAVTRNKVFDHFRRRQREVAEDQADEPIASEAPLSARDMLRWAQTKLPDHEAAHTLEWMLREGDGEKLEEIARDADLPAPRVRQRVSRLRRFLRERWAAELVLSGLGLALLVGAGIYYFRHRDPRPEIAKPSPDLRAEPPVSPERRGQELRRLALENCRNGQDSRCLEGLDQARVLDPLGDAAAEVVSARREAVMRLLPPRSPAPPAKPTPSSIPRPPPVRKPGKMMNGSSELSGPIPSKAPSSSSIDGS